MVGELVLGVVELEAHWTRVLDIPDHVHVLKVSLGMLLDRLVAQIAVVSLLAKLRSQDIQVSLLELGVLVQIETLMESDF